MQIKTKKTNHETHLNKQISICLWK